MPERAFTQWSPDTCDCVIQYYNDDITHHATVQACPKHQANAGSQQHLDDVLGHNRNKNYVAAHLLEMFGVDTYNDKGDPIRRLPAGVVLSYDPVAPVEDDPVIVTGLSDIQNTMLKGELLGMASRGGAVPGTVGGLSTASGDVVIRIPD